jgi:hypothetical protein
MGQRKNAGRKSYGKYWTSLAAVRPILSTDQAAKQRAGHRVMAWSKVARN